MDHAPQQLNLYGNEKHYQKVGRSAFPILIHLAKVREFITYGELAKKINVSNPRNLNYPLGSVWVTLYELQEEWRVEIPQIDIPYLTSLVVNKDTGHPGYEDLPQSEFEAECRRVFNFPIWTSVQEVVLSNYWLIDRDVVSPAN